MLKCHILADLKQKRALSCTQNLTVSFLAIPAIYLFLTALFFGNAQLEAGTTLPFSQRAVIVFVSLAAFTPVMGIWKALLDIKELLEEQKKVPPPPSP